MKVFIFSAMILMTYAIPNAYATFTFTATPDQGGRDIRFSPVKPGEQTLNETLNVVITSDEGKQYQLIQRQMSPFSSDDGFLSPGAVQMSSSTNVSGNMAIRSLTPVVPNQSKVIYTSDSSGLSESFDITFILQPSKNERSGHYQTQLIYELVSQGRAAVTYVLNVSLEIRSDFSFEIKSITGQRTMHLGKVSQKRPVGDVSMDFSVNGSGHPYKIFHRLLSPLINQHGKRLPEALIQFTAGKASEGTIAQPVGVLTTHRELLYQSTQQGSSANWVVKYIAQEATSEAAGTYEGMVEFVVETSGTGLQVQPLQMKIVLEIESIFYLDVSYGQSTSLHFGLLKNSGDEETRNVTIKAHNNNDGQKYQVVQDLTRPFTNQDGKVLEGKYFTAIMEGDVDGIMAYANRGPVESGETVVYTSNSSGDSAEFVISYSVTLPPNFGGGDYGTEASYLLIAV